MGLAFALVASPIAARAAGPNDARAATKAGPLAVSAPVAPHEERPFPAIFAWWIIGLGAAIGGTGTYVTYDALHRGGSSGGGGAISSSGSGSSSSGSGGAADALASEILGPSMIAIGVALIAWGTYELVRPPSVVAPSAPQRARRGPRVIVGPGAIVGTF